MNLIYLQNIILLSGSQVPDLLFLVFTLLLVVTVLLVVYLINRRNHFANARFELLEKSKELRKKISHIRYDSQSIIKNQKDEIKSEIAEIQTSIRALKTALKAADEGALRNSELLSNISYTLRTNLNDIMGFSNLLEHEFARQEENELYNFSQDIRSSGQSLLHLLNNMIDISRINAGSFSVVTRNCKINDVIQEVVKTFEPAARHKGLTISFDPVTMPRFSTDVEAVKHILSNLLDNAIKFTEKGFVKIGCEKESSRIIISVKDTGVGIDKAFLPELFEPYAQSQPGYTKTAQKGSALGLPLVKQLLDLLNGEIDFQSEKAIGTTVTISLPLIQPVQEVKKTTTKSKVSTASKLPDLKVSISNLLIVDGDPFNKLLIKKMIPDIKQIVQVANEEDLQKVFEEKKKWDLVLMDTDFIKIDYGIGLLKKYSDTFSYLKKTPFIALMSVPDESKEHICLEEGFKDCLEKPITKGKLIKVLNKTL
ncbi:MAG: hybrid sensor histidine kinase/response regulator [Bacteroidales bacterium]|nr:hybrid sensor histidine kinase/response regulator [Bacteroidales bacterium]